MDLLDGIEEGTYVGPFCTDMTNDGAVDCFVGDGATTEVYYYQSNPYPSAAPSPMPTLRPTQQPTFAPFKLAVVSTSIRLQNVAWTASDFDAAKKLIFKMFF